MVTRQSFSVSIAVAIAIARVSIFESADSDPQVFKSWGEDGGNLISAEVEVSDEKNGNNCSIVLYDKSLAIGVKWWNLFLEQGGIPVPPELFETPDTTQSAATGGAATSGSFDPANIQEGLQGDELATAIVSYCGSTGIGITDKAHIAAILGTAEIESSMGVYLEEIDDGSGYSYLGSDAEWHGRGLIQVTLRSNYEKLSKLMGADFIANPELLTELKYAIPALCLGMRDGWYTASKLSDFGTESNYDFDGSRDIVNPGEGGTRRSNYVSYCQKWLKRLKAGEILIGAASSIVSSAGVAVGTIASATTALGEAIAVETAATETKANSSATANPEDAIIRVFISGGDDATGFIVRPDGTFMTCQHVSASSVGYAVLKDGSQVSVTFLAQDAGQDMAIGRLASRAAAYPYIVLAASSGLQIGSQVSAIGMAQSKPPWYRSTGTVTSLTATSNVPSATIGTTAGLLEPGNSGCPVFGDSSAVVGMAQAIASVSGEGRVIPAEKLQDYLRVNGITLPSSTSALPTLDQVGEQSARAAGYELVVELGRYTDEILQAFHFLVTGITIDKRSRQVTIAGQGVRSLMSKSPKFTTHANYSLRQLASKIAGNYGLNVDIPDIDAAEKVAAIALQQNKTDKEFLRTQAEAAGFTIVEDGKTLKFLPLNQTVDQRVILTNADCLPPRFRESATKDRVTGQGLPDISSVVEDSPDTLGRGFQCDLSVVRSASTYLALQPGAIAKLDESLAGEFAREFKIGSIRHSWSKNELETAIGLYLPVKRQSDKSSQPPSGTQGQQVTSGAGASATAIVNQARTWIDRDFKKGESERCMDFVRTAVLTPINHPKAEFVTASAWDGLDTGRNLASSLSGTDCGTQITSIAALLPGDLVFFHSTYGNFGNGANGNPVITHIGVITVAGADPLMVDRSTSSAPVRERGIVATFPGKFALGVRLS